MNRDLIGVDYVEVNEFQLRVLQAALGQRPVLLHDISYRFWLNYEDPFNRATMDKARAMIDLAQPPWHSTGIGASAEPQGHTTEYWRGAPADALQPRTRCLANIVRNAGKLQAWLGIPLLLENYNYHPTNAYEYVCDPATFSKLMEIDCGMLLDLAHAQISAFNLGWPDVLCTPTSANCRWQACVRSTSITLITTTVSRCSTGTCPSATLTSPCWSGHWPARLWWRL